MLYIMQENTWEMSFRNEVIIISCRVTVYLVYLPSSVFGTVEQCTDYQGQTFHESSPVWW